MFTPEDKSEKTRVRQKTLKPTESLIAPKNTPNNGLEDKLIEQERVDLQTELKQ